MGFYIFVLIVFVTNTTLELNTQYAFNNAKFFGPNEKKAFGSGYVIYSLLRMFALMKRVLISLNSTSVNILSTNLKSHNEPKKKSIMNHSLKSFTTP